MGQVMGEYAQRGDQPIDGCYFRAKAPRKEELSLVPTTIKMSLHAGLRTGKKQLQEVGVSD